jgi:two-component system chemotaxis response regulator CheB
MSQIVSQLPRDLKAAVFMVLHIPPNAISVMPAILRRAGSLPAVHAASREPMREGVIYIAPPDRHMLIRQDTVITTFGPRENNHRPAIDPLFRSAAEIYGPRAIGVILTGNLDDGTSGLTAIKDRGGIAIVQDPDDAVHSGMPTSAVENVTVDYVLPLKEIAATIVRVVESVRTAPPAAPSNGDHLDIEVRKAELDNGLPRDAGVGEVTGFTCPECGGSLWEVNDATFTRYRCRVGHAFSVDSLVSAYGGSVEAALWAALRSLDENVAFTHRLAKRAESNDQRAIFDRFMAQAARISEHADALRGILKTGPIEAEPEHEVTAPE